MVEPAATTTGVTVAPALTLLPTVVQLDDTYRFGSRAVAPTLGRHGDLRSVTWAPNQAEYL